MDSVYEDVRSILENRRIRSEILQEQRNEQIRQQYPELAKIEKEIEDTTEQLLLNSLDGKSSEDLERELRILNRKKENILASCGISTDEFEAKPFCSKCGDTGYIHEMGKNGSETVILCECIRSLIAPVMLSRSGVEKYPEYSFEKGSDEYFSSDPRMMETYIKLKLLTNKEEIPNSVFYGRSGKGKTFTAVAIAREYAQKGRSSFVIRMSEAQELMMEHRKILQAFYTPADKERAVEQKVDYLTEADLLVLDDLGMEPRTANTEADLLNLLDKRSLAGKSTIITTNFDMESLKERYGGRFFDRIDRKFARFHFSMEGSRT